MFSNGIDTIKNRYIANERKKKKKSITKSAPINGFHFTWKMMMFNMVILAFTSLAFALFPLIFPLLLFCFDLVWKNARNPFWAVQRTLALSLSWSVSCLSDRKLQLFHFIFFLLHFISFSLCFFLCFAVTYAVVYRLMIRFVVVVVFFHFALLLLPFLFHIKIYLFDFIRKISTRFFLLLLLSLQELGGVFSWLVTGANYH